MNDFKDKGYVIIKEAITKEMATMAYNYLLLKRQVYDTMIKNKWLSVTAEEWGQYNDRQVPDTYAIYADTLMETMLMYVRPKMEKITELQLVETYSYARIYKKGDILKKHKDRPSCQVSTTLNLGGDKWPIFIEPDIEVNLNPGDMLVYKGELLEHWRNEFDGQDCAQVFLHYNDINSEHKNENIYDYRPHIGLPAWFKKYEK
tara:strand:- start:1326 stop:1934 length:609 start_codon:yes stop_codon:yes gene_type:complete